MLEVDDFFNKTYVEIEKKADSWFADLVKSSGKTKEEMKATKGGMIESLVEVFNGFYANALLDSVSDIESVRKEMMVIWNKCNSDIKDFLIEHKDDFITGRMIHENSAKLMKEICQKRRESVRYVSNQKYNMAVTDRDIYNKTEYSVSGYDFRIPYNPGSHTKLMEDKKMVVAGIYDFIPGFYQARSFEEALGLIDAFYNVENLPTQTMIQERLDRVAVLHTEHPCRREFRVDGKFRELAAKTFEKFIENT